MTALLLLLLAQAAPIPSPDDTPWLPPLADLSRFPCGLDAWPQVQRHRHHITWLEKCRTLPVLDARYGRRWHDAAIAETQRRMQAWELLANARGGGESMRWWGIPPRALLDMLRSHLGEEDYLRGRMPTPLPEGLPRVREVEERSGNNR